MSIYETNSELLKTLHVPLEIMRKLISRGTCNVNELVGILNVPQSTVSQHLGKLKSQKLIMGNRNGLEIYYSVPKSKGTYIIQILLDKKLVPLK
ncbi:helix-turn-helix transcriptional regulator [Bacillus cereus]|uniref:metalloregulator ArsR/SmtB family transcription factor n=1 Tax=Bacillus cereus TaxID=1396 RepID=UPI0018F449B3|nr:helix-turn-helix transcriptional regulator [Bacillus cereus]